MTSFRKERPSRLPYIVLALSIFLATSAIFLLIFRNRDNPPEEKTPPASSEESVTENVPELDAPLGNEITPDKPEALELHLAAEDPQDLVSRLAKALESGDLDAVMKLTGSATVDPIASARLREFAAARGDTRDPLPIRKVEGEGTEDGTHWELTLPDNQRLSLKLEKTDRGWVLKSVRLPQESGAETEVVEKVSPSREAAEAFVQSVLKQDFETAKKLVDAEKISDTKIAGLCILFEEGGYRLRQDRAIREVLQRGDTAAFLINLNSQEGEQSAQFGMTLHQANGTWKVAEANLDGLLADYAAKFSQGDVYYTPLVKNPSGGDTLALYFDFDSGNLDPRAKRQLEIVAKVLSADESRKINISGHTDALGTEHYNQALSRERADQVRDFLVSFGVPESQIVMDALGASQPRRPNVTSSGEDNPDGRRVNRRAEMYLDF